MKNKNILLTLGAAAATVAPIAVAVSCGTKSSGGLYDKYGNLTKFVSGSSPTKYVPSAQKDYYETLINKRVFGQSGHGQTAFGLWSGVANKSGYEYGKITDSIGYNLNYLQNGKLLMASFYHKHKNDPSFLEAGDMRRTLSRIGDVLQATIDAKNQNISTELTLKGSAAEQKEIKDALTSFKVDGVVTSNPKSITTLDYLGLGTLDKVFNKPKYIDAKAGSVEYDNKRAVMSYFGSYFSDFQYDLLVDFEKHTVAENEALAYAYEEVMGYSWDYLNGALGDRKNPSPVLIQKWMHIPNPIDHNTTISQWRVDNGHENVNSMKATAAGKNGYASKLYELSATGFTASNSVYFESTNDLRAKGINIVDTGTPRYDETGKLTSGKETKRHLEFGLFDSVSLTSNGSTTIFNSDDVSSTNPKSINGTAFKNSIASGNVTKISFHIKTGGKWVKGGSGVKTNHDITSEDFWYSLQRKNYSTDGARNSIKGTGGKLLPSGSKTEGERSDIAKALEDSFEKSNTNKTSFKAPAKNASTSNLFLSNTFSNMYGMEPIDITPASKTKVTPTANDLSFAVKSSAKASQIALFWNKYIATPGSDNLTAIPSEKIKEYVAKQQAIVASAGVGGFDGTKPVIKYGVYYRYLGQNLSDFEYAGKYYPNVNDDKKIIMAKNDEYINPAWKTTKNTIKKLTYQFIDQSSAYAITLEDEYKRGNIYKISLNDKNLAGWKKEILSSSQVDKDSLGLTYLKLATSLADTAARFYTVALPFDTTAPTLGKYFYNDNWAKIMYGGTIKELWDAPTVEKLVKTLYYGHGLQFRSSLQAALNGTAILKDFNAGSQANNSIFGPEALIPGTGTPKNIYDSDIFNRVSFGSKKADTVEISEQDYRAAQSAQEGNFAYLINGQKLSDLKANIAHAIKESGVTGKIISELPLNYTIGIGSINYANYLSHMQWAYNKLNDQIDFVANVKPLSLLK